MVKYGNIALRIIATILTCGIYGLFWMASINNNVNRLSSNDRENVSGGMTVLLLFLTCGIYGYYWVYKMGVKIDEAKIERGIPTSNKTGMLYLGILFVGLLLGLVGMFLEYKNIYSCKYYPLSSVVTIVIYALMQDEINKFAQIQD